MANRTITLQSDGPIKEALAAATIYPGEILQRVPAAATVRRHGNSLDYCQPLLVALEDENQGNEITEAYAAGDRVFFRAPQKGDVMLLRVAQGYNVTKHAPVYSNGDGRLRTGSGTVKEGALVGISLEAVNMSDSSLADPDSFIQVEIA